MTNYNSSPGRVHCNDGPAKKKAFYVQRAPLYLRLVQDLNDKWDALDLLEDEPTDEEEVFVYCQTQWMHVRGNTRGDSGYYYLYAWVPISRELKLTLRSNDKWRDWASLQTVPQLTDS